MAISLRHLGVLILGFFPCGLLLSAQSHSTPEHTPAVFQLFSVTPVADMLYDLKGKAVSVSVGQNSYSPAYRTPADGSLTFYRLIPTTKPDHPPERMIVATVSVDAHNGATILVVLYPDGPPKPFNENEPPQSLKSLALDNSRQAYPSGTARVVTFSTRPVVVKIGQTIVPLTTLSPSLVPYPSGERTWLQVATTGEQGWQRVIGTPQILAPNTRLSLFMSDIPPSKNDPNPAGLSLKKIIEPLHSDETISSTTTAATLTRR